MTAFLCQLIINSHIYFQIGCFLISTINFKVSVIMLNTNKTRFLWTYFLSLSLFMTTPSRAQVVQNDTVQNITVDSGAAQNNSAGNTTKLIERMMALSAPQPEETGLLEMAIQYYQENKVAMALTAGAITS